MTGRSEKCVSVVSVGFCVHVYYYVYFFRKCWPNLAAVIKSIRAFLLLTGDSSQIFKYDLLFSKKSKTLFSATNKMLMMAMMINDSNPIRRFDRRGRGGGGSIKYYLLPLGRVRNCINRVLAKSKKRIFVQRWQNQQ